MTKNVFIELDKRIRKLEASWKCQIKINDNQIKINANQAEINKAFIRRWQVGK